MGFMNDVIHMIICLFEVYMVFDLYNSFLEKKELYVVKKLSGVVIVVLSVLVRVINLFDNTIINLVGVPCIFLILAVIVFEGNVYKKIICCMIAVMILFGTELVFSIILSLTSSDLIASSMVDETSMLLVIIIMKLLSFIIFTLFKQYSSKSVTRIDKKVFTMYMVVPLASVGIMLAIAYCEIDLSSISYAKILMIWFYVMLLLGNAFVFKGFNQYSQEVEKNALWEKTLLKQQMEYEGYIQLREMNEKSAQLIHDFSHYMLMLSDYIEENKINEARRLLSEIGRKVERFKVVKYSNNPVIDTILSNYGAKAKVHDVDFDVFVESGFNVEFVEQMDLVSMFGNLLSNALEGTMKCDRKKISIKLFMQNDGRFAVIKIENTFDGVIKQEEDHLKTTKQNEFLHGVGLLSVKAVAENYNGYLQSSWTEDIFKNIIILQNNKNCP